MPDFDCIGTDLSHYLDQRFLDSKFTRRHSRARPADLGLARDQHSRWAQVGNSRLGLAENPEPITTGRAYRFRVRRILLSE
jgi:hypothetical protein